MKIPMGIGNLTLNRYLSSPVHQKNPHRDHGKTYQQRNRQFLMKEKDAKDDPEDWCKESKGRKPTHRIFVNELEPYEISDEGNDDRLIEKRGNDRWINFVDPLWFKDNAHHKKDWN